VELGRHGGFEQGPRMAEMTCMGYSEEFAYSNTTLPLARREALPITKQSLYWMHWNTTWRHGCS
jgi:hypothetical protein